MRTRLRSRLSDSRGFAIPTVMGVMVVAAAFAAVGATTVIRALSDSSRDRSSTAAFQLADSGVNATLFHMNRHMSANEVQSLVDMGTGTIQTEACLEIEGGVVVGNVVTVGSDGGFCAGISIPGLADSDETSTCWTDLRLNEPVSLPAVIQRRIVCQGTVNGVSRRAGARVEMDLDVNGNPTSLWELTEWVECTSERETGFDPAEGCGPLETTV